MSDATKSPEEIRAEIEATRSQMTSRLDTLQDKLSTDNLKTQMQAMAQDAVREGATVMKEYLSTNMRDLSRSLADSFKRNPVPSALVLAGLGWMVFGNGGRNERMDPRFYERFDDRRRYAAGRYSPSYGYSNPGTNYGAEYGRGGYVQDYMPNYDYGQSSYGHEQGGYVHGGSYSHWDERGRWSQSQRDFAGNGGRQGPVERVKDAAGNIVERFADAAGNVFERVTDAAGNVRERAVETGANVAGAVRNAAEGVKETADSLGSRVSDVVDNLTDQGNESLHRAGSSAEQMSRDVGQQARYIGSQVRDRFEHMGEQARETGDAWREQARYTGYQLRNEAMDLRRQAGDMSQRFGDEAQYQAMRAQETMVRSLDENPLAFGAVALLAGAALAMALPATRREAQLMGETRDRFVERAQSLASNVVQDVKQVAEEVRPQLEETARRVVDDLTQTGKEVAGAVTDSVSQASKTVGEKVTQAAGEVTEAVDQSVRSAASAVKSEVEKSSGAISASGSH